MADDSDSDEWGMEELVIPQSAGKADEESKLTDVGDDYWAVEKPTPKEESKNDNDTPAKEESPGDPLIIVDITQIDANIHSKFDRNSVNDSAAASAMRKKIETNYQQYAKDSNLLADGTVVPCGSSVWRAALVRLRDERPGHYFAPIFPPKKK